MGRPPVVERMEEARRGPWTPEEDIMLVSYIQEHGIGSWRLVPKNAGLQRCGKSCRLRWNNYLRPGIKRGKFTPEEERIIIRHQALLGNRWAAIAAHLPSRTDNDIKNYWYTHLKKKLDKVDSSGDERARNYEDYKHYEDAATTGGLNASAGNSVRSTPQNNQEKKSVYCDKVYLNATAGNSMTTPPQNYQENKSVYDDNGIMPLTSIEKWLLEDPSAPFPQILPSPGPAAPAPSTAPGRDGHDHLLNMFTPFSHDQISFGPFY